jgi:hypothetical protein
VRTDPTEVLMARLAWNSYIKVLMCVTSKVFYETMINDERFSLSVVICRSFLSKKEREKKKFLCFLGERDTFFSKAARKD